MNRQSASDFQVNYLVDIVTAIGKNTECGINLYRQLWANLKLATDRKYFLPHA